MRKRAREEHALHICILPMRPAGGDIHDSMCRMCPVSSPLLKVPEPSEALEQYIINFDKTCA